MKIAVTGATGFVGSHFINYILEHTQHEIVALSRSKMVSSHHRLQTISCDLYSLLEVSNALKGCDAAIYLVHSMSPSSRLSQGGFEDFDFLLADNFSKATEENNIKHILYVSGLVNEKNKISKHLKSRLEVEELFLGNKVPVTTFRCSIILGPKGSSFTIVKNLVHRLPVILLPKWALTKTQVISMRDLLKIMSYSIENPIKSVGSFDLAGARAHSYAGFIKIVAKVMNRNNYFIKFPFIPIWLSKYWIRFVTSYPKDLVYPLVESLKHPMVVSSERLWPHHKSHDFEDIEETVKWSLNPEHEAKIPASKEASYDPIINDLVQSVQRLPCPNGWSAQKIANEYMHWLPKFMRPFLKIIKNDNFLSFYILFLKRPLLVLELSSKQLAEDRELFYIIGGLLVKPYPKARLEFRLSPDQKFMIAAIHNFRPNIPWYLYRYTQAVLHQWVMKKFGKHLEKQGA